MLSLDIKDLLKTRDSPHYARKRILAFLNCEVQLMFYYVKSNRRPLLKLPALNQQQYRQPALMPAYLQQRETEQRRPGRSFALVM